MIPLVFRDSISATRTWGITVEGSWGFRSKPGTSLMKTSRLARRAIATSAATTSALQL